MTEEEMKAEAELRADIAVLAMRADFMGWPGTKSFLTAAQVAMTIESAMAPERRAILAERMNDLTRRFIAGLEQDLKKQ